MAVGVRLAMVALVVAGLCAGLVASSGAPPAQDPPTNDVCLTCHGDPGATSAAGRSVAVDETRFGGSVHGSMAMACVDCHTDLAATEDFPHAERLARVSCSTCHSDAVAAYDLSSHALARRQDTASVAATCVDCHTAHEIRPAADPESTTYALNLPTTCSRCHGSADVIAAGRIAIGNVGAAYADSIHGRAISRSGLVVAATCTSCHGAHDIRPGSDPGSRVHRANIPSVCGACHEGIERVYETGAHGVGVTSGIAQAAVCADCHTAHDIQRAEAPAWQLDVIAECGTCHTDQIRTYRDTFHGQVTSLGYTRVATCASCHGSHAIFASDDPRSMISSTRLLTTCQQCHTEATEGFTGYDPHADKHNRERNPELYWASRAMTWLLVGTFGFFGLHTLLWLPRSALARREKRRARAAAPETTADPEA
ncbi:MAG TPA: cytochrome c3 family protein [Vicinamibacterales bacterium]|nr:cytochrome c3 family protein [Vicinamibacterales bacterium]